MTSAEHAGSSRAVAAMIGVGIVVAVLYVARDVLIPLVLAVFLAFLLAPVVRAVPRVRVKSLRLGRIPAVLVVVTAAAALMSAGAWFIGSQLMDLGEQLPKYQLTLTAKARALRQSISERLWPVSQALNVIHDEMAHPTTSPASAPAAPPGVERPLLGQQAPRLPPAGGAATPAASPGDAAPRETALLPLVRAALPIFHPIIVALLTAILAIFILIQHEDLRDRIIRLCGDANIGLTTNMLSDAAARISRYFFGLVMVNTAIGTAIAAGLTLIGMPNAVLFGMLTIILRFVPFLGSWAAAGLPIALSLAIFDGWMMPLMVAFLYIAIEVLGASVEPWIYGSRIGASPTVIIISTAIWTWLWGGVGLLLATPITVCLVVLGKHLPQLQWLYIALGDEPVFPPHARFFQRLLAMDANDATAIVQTAAVRESLETAFSEIVMPGLSMLAAEERAGDLGQARETTAKRIVEALLETIPAAPVEPTQANGPARGREGGPPLAIVPAGGFCEELAARVLARLVESRGETTRVVPQSLLATELRQAADGDAPHAACLVTLGAANDQRVSDLCKLLARMRPELNVLVGQWDPQSDSESPRGRWARFPRARLYRSLAELLAALPSGASGRRSDFVAPSAGAECGVGLTIGGGKLAGTGPGRI